MRHFRNAPRWARGALGVAAAGAVGLVVAGLVLAFVFALAYANLPSIDTLTDYQPRIPLRVWTADGVLIGEFGEERRDYVPIHDVPKRVQQAILAAEDDAFYRHHGVDYAGLARAVVANFSSGRRGQGGSTITMQVARNFYLSSERSYLRKIYEIALAYKIESELTKDRILEVYANQIFLGQRAYGFSAAAQTYFGKKLPELTVAEAAMLAGLPAAPSAYNPWVNPRRAKVRQQYVLSRMLQLGFITAPEHDAAVAEPLKARHALAAASPNSARALQHAQFAAEMARLAVFETYREEAYSLGLNVHTTLVSGEQLAAYEAVRSQVLSYDRRYGYRGPEAFIELPADPARRDQRIEDAIVEAIESPNLLPAVVVDASPKQVRVVVQGGESIEISGEGLRFAARSLDPKAQPARRIVPGALVRVARLPKGNWEIVQLPQVEAAFVAADAQDGSVRALVGGFDFNLNKFNHATQAWRQPGSSFKPFVYSAALERGFMPSTLVNDAPFAVDPAETGGQPWEPKNYDGKFDGPLRLRQALARSKNLVSIRVIKAIGPQFAQKHVARFGFEPGKHPPYLTMALGAGSVTPWQMAGAYAVFANGGYRVPLLLIDRVTDSRGRVLMAAQRVQAGAEGSRAVDARNAFVMDSLLRDVTRYGTAASAARLRRDDIAGKTGTTNDSHDAWFAGYGGGVVAVAWMGFDQPRPLGDRETGGGLALPMWIAYMAKVLPNRPPIEPATAARVREQIF
ncbi:MAG: PBP1A family penicillin-binding protein [Burkholderiaceae bacterium]|nr:PBP1A family penicillin-binding protein [Burkholderiaceae bacterium]